MFNILDHLKHTATGLDGIPAWFLRLGAPIFAEPLRQLFNQSLSFGIVPTQWKRSCILPIPKVPVPTGVGEYRPISITSVISRMIERVVVRSFIYPAILDPPPSLSFDDQFAFRPTGSTTAAVIHLLQTVTDILITQPYVRVISLDFSKAFDSVRHVELVRKLSLLNIPDNIFNWIVSFLEDRIHCTNFNGMVSIFAAICASIIQGSGIGPAAYVVNAGDLQPYNPGNRMSKFADDTRLIVPACNTNTCETELAHRGRP